MGNRGTLSGEITILLSSIVVGLEGRVEWWGFPLRKEYAASRSKVFSTNLQK